MPNGAEKINRKKTITGFLILTVFLGPGICTFLSAHAQQPIVDWSPTFHHDLRRTCYSTSIGPLTNQTLWSYTTDNSVEYTSPAIVNGVVFVGSHDHNVYALNAATGPKYGLTKLMIPWSLPQLLPTG